MLKLLIVDDSPFMRRELTRIFESDQSIEVVGTGRDGLDAIKKTKELRPDVIALDINMPRMDGLTALQHIMIECPTPCVIISSLTQHGADETFEALDLGAVDYIPKPSGALSLDIAKIKSTMINKLKTAARAKLVPRVKKRVKVKKNMVLPEGKKIFTNSVNVCKSKSDVSQKLVVIGVSTGGPKTLLDIVPKIPEDLNAGLIIAQHMPGGFTTNFAKRLNTYSPMSIKEADNSDVIENGRGYLSPGQYHIRVASRGVINAKGIINLSTNPEESSYRPCVDVLFESAAEIYGANTIGVILTGMGRDGVKGLEKIKNAGGTTIAEDESTCIIYGMPKGAIERGLADHILPAGKIAEEITRLVSLSDG